MSLNETFACYQLGLSEMVLSRSGAPSSSVMYSLHDGIVEMMMSSLPQFNKSHDAKRRRRPLHELQGESFYPLTRSFSTLAINHLVHELKTVMVHISHQHHSLDQRKDAPPLPPWIPWIRWTSSSWPSWPSSWGSRGSNVCPGYVSSRVRTKTGVCELRLLS